MERKVERRISDQLGTSHTEGHALTNCANPPSYKARSSLRQGKKKKKMQDSEKNKLKLAQVNFTVHLPPLKYYTYLPEGNTMPHIL